MAGMTLPNRYWRIVVGAVATGINSGNPCFGVFRTDTTDAGGTYCFGLPEGKYFVRIKPSSLPAGMVISPKTRFPGVPTNLNNDFSNNTFTNGNIIDLAAGAVTINNLDGALITPVAACAISIEKVTVSGCYISEGVSYSDVAVEVKWNTTTLNDSIAVKIGYVH